jgi:hypothetical protein
VRVGVELADVVAVPAGTQVTLKVTVDLENPTGKQAAKPALVAEILTLLA